MLTLPQPFEDLGHLDDVGVRVRGESAEVALGRLALALAALLSGGGPLPGDEVERLAVPGGPGLAGTAVAFLRELVSRFETAGVIPAAVEVVRVDEAAAEARVRWAPYDPEQHAEGVDVKAVAWHLALLAHEDGEWIGQAVFDV